MGPVDFWGVFLSVLINFNSSSTNDVCQIRLSLNIDIGSDENISIPEISALTCFDDGLNMAVGTVHSPIKTALSPREKSFNLQKNTGQNVLNRIRTGKRCSLTYAP